MPEDAPEDDTLADDHDDTSPVRVRNGLARVEVHMIAIYPGTFDPLRFGHLNIIARASLICNRLIVAVAENSGKKPVIFTEERA